MASSRFFIPNSMEKDTVYCDKKYLKTLAKNVSLRVEPKIQCLE